LDAFDVENGVKQSGDKD